MPQPRIGITSGLHGEVWSNHGLEWQPYVDAITRCGGEAVRLDLRTLGRARAALTDLQGILFTGGEDIHPASWPRPLAVAGSQLTQHLTDHRVHADPHRDAYELPLLLEALQQDLPILGICRGCQLLHVALGGQLILDIPSQIGSPVQHESGHDLLLPYPTHPVQIVPGTLLASILPPEQYRTANSSHHQALSPDPHLPTRVNAVSPDDGIIEGIELPGRRWALAVQWHPEAFQNPEIRDAHAPLFEQFVQACA